MNAKRVRGLGQVGKPFRRPPMHGHSPTAKRTKRVATSHRPDADLSPIDRAEDGEPNFYSERNIKAGLAGLLRHEINTRLGDIGNIAESLRNYLRLKTLKAPVFNECKETILEACNRILEITKRLDPTNKTDFFLAAYEHGPIIIFNDTPGFIPNKNYYPNNPMKRRDVLKHLKQDKGFLEGIKKATTKIKDKWEELTISKARATNFTELNQYITETWNHVQDFIEHKLGRPRLH